MGKTETVFKWIGFSAAVILIIVFLSCKNTEKGCNASLDPTHATLISIFPNEAFAEIRSIMDSVKANEVNKAQRDFEASKITVGELVKAYEEDIYRQDEGSKRLGVAKALPDAYKYELEIYILERMISRSYESSKIGVDMLTPEEIDGEEKMYVDEYADTVLALGTDFFGSQLKKELETNKLAALNKQDFGILIEIAKLSQYEKSVIFDKIERDEIVKNLEKALEEIEKK